MQDATDIRQFCVYTQRPEFLSVVTWLKENQIKYEAHLNRTRFWIPQGPAMTEFLLRWYEICPQVMSDEDYQLGYSIKEKI